MSFKSLRFPLLGCCRQLYAEFLRLHRTRDWWYFQGLSAPPRVSPNLDSATLLTLAFYCSRLSTATFACDNFGTAALLPLNRGSLYRSPRRVRSAFHAYPRFVAPSTLRLLLGPNIAFGLHRGINSPYPFFKVRALFTLAIIQHSQQKVKNFMHEISCLPLCQLEKRLSALFHDTDYSIFE